MKTVKVYLQDGYHYTTQMNSKCTDEEIQQYFYHGAIVNIGNITDELKKVDRIEITE